MDDAPEQHQLGELNIAPLAYASPGTTKEPGGACSSLADTRLGRWAFILEATEKCQAFVNGIRTRSDLHSLKDHSGET